jgi:hypothetical protein
MTTQHTNPTTTLAKIRAAHPCSDGWQKLLAGLGYQNGTFDSNREVSLGDIVTTNDMQDAMWVVQCLDWQNIAVRRAVLAGAVLPAVRRIIHNTTDQRSHQALADLEKWCNGDDTIDLEKVYRAAASAAYAAAAAASAAYAAASAAYAAAAAASAASAASERQLQRDDILVAFPLVALAKD